MSRPAAFAGLSVPPTVLHHRRLRRSVGAELALGAVVIALAAALVATVPANESYAPSLDTVLSGRDPQGDTIAVQLSVTPTESGFQRLSIRTSGVGGVPLAFRTATGSLTERDVGLGPIDVTFTSDGTARGSAGGVAVPVPGRWNLVLQVTIDTFTDYSATTSYDVSAAPASS